MCVHVCRRCSKDCNPLPTQDPGVGRLLPKYENEAMYNIAYIQWKPWKRVNRNTFNIKKTIYHKFKYDGSLKHGITNERKRE